MKIPSDTEWGDLPKVMDLGCAYRHFFGKTLEEAYQMFADNALTYQEDLDYMPKLPFQYYVRAYIHYILSERTSGDSDAANCFIGLIETHLRDNPTWIAETWESVRRALTKISVQQEEFYDACPSIYGDFNIRIEKLLLKRTNAIDEF